MDTESQNKSRATTTMYLHFLVGIGIASGIIMAGQLFGLDKPDAPVAGVIALFAAMFLVLFFTILRGVRRAKAIASEQID